MLPGIGSLFFHFATTFIIKSLPVLLSSLRIYVLALRRLVLWSQYTESCIAALGVAMDLQLKILKKVKIFEIDIYPL